MSIVLNKSFGIGFKGNSTATVQLKLGGGPSWPPAYVNWDGSTAPTGTPTATGDFFGAGYLGGVAYDGTYLYQGASGGNIYRAEPSDINGTKTQIADINQYIRSMTYDGEKFWIGYENGWIATYDTNFNHIVDIVSTGGGGGNAPHGMDYYDGLVWVIELDGDVSTIDPTAETPSLTFLGRVAEAAAQCTGIQIFDDYIVYLKYGGTVLGVNRSDITGATVWTDTGYSSVVDDMQYIDSQATLFSWLKNTSTYETTI